MRSSIRSLLWILLGAGAPVASTLADCTPGESRCGADSQVERCTADHTWSTDAATICDRNIPNRPMDPARFDERRRPPAESSPCTAGISRCGADGRVERCTDANTWTTDPGSTCTR
jgi:hypothetical protein